MPGKTLAELLKKVDFDNITPEQRLEGIKLMNEQLKKAGIKSMTDDEMVALSEDTDTLKRFRRAKKVKKAIDECKKAKEITETMFNGIPTPLRRSVFYLYDISGTKEAEEKNKKLEEKMSTIEGQREIFRDLFQKMKQQDLGVFHTSNIDEQIEFLSTDTKTKMFMFETDYPHAEFNKYEEKIFDKENEEIYLQIKGSVQAGGQYQDNVSATANPMSLFLPELSTSELLMLYSSAVKELGPEIAASINNIMNRQVNLDSLKNSKTVYNMLKRNEFYQEGYGIYAVNKGSKITGAMGIDYLSDSARGDVTFYKYKLGDPEKKPVDSIEITEQVILNDSKTKLSEKRQQLVDSIKTAKFTGTPLEVEFKKAAALGLIDVNNAREKDFDALKQDVANNIEEAERGDRLYNTGWQTFSTEEKEKIVEKLKDERISKKYLDIIKNISSQVENSKAVNQPGDLVFKGIFNPKIDGSGFVKLSGNEESIAKINQAQKEAEEIEIPTDIFDEKEASYIVFSEYIKPEYIKEGYVLSTVGPGSSLPEGFDAFDGGLGNFFENTVGNDERENMHYSRLYAPRARKDAIELIEKFKNGDKQPLADSMKRAFTDCLLFAKATRDPKVRRNTIKYDSAIDLYDILQGEKFKGYVSFSEEEKQYVNFLRLQKKITNEYIALKEEIAHYSVMKQVEGKSDPKSDRELQEKIIKFNARAYFLERQETYTEAYSNVMVGKYGIMHAETELNKRPMYEFEKNILHDPEAYMEGLEEHFRGRENEFISVSKYDNYLDLAKDIGSTEKLDIAKPGLICGELENEALRSKIKQMIEQFEFSAKYAEDLGKAPFDGTYKVLETLKNLPCMKEDFPEHPTSADIDARISEYKQAMETLGDRMYDFVEMEDGEPNRNSLEFKTTFDLAIERLENAKSEYKLEADLKTKTFQAERDKIQKAYEAENGPQFVEKVEEIKIDEEPVENIFNQLTRTEADKMLEDIAGELDNAQTNKFHDPKIDEIMDVMAEWKKNRDTNPPVGNVFKEDVQKKIDELIDDINEKMMDSEDPMLEEELSMLTRLGSAVEMSAEAKDIIPEAMGENSPYQEAYKRINEQIKHMKQELQNDRFTSVAEGAKDPYHNVTDKAITAMENIRDAIENEAFNLNGPKIKDIDAKDIATVSAYQFLKVEGADRPDVSKNILKNNEKAINSLAQHKMVKENLKNLNIYDLNNNLKASNGFTNFLKEKPKVQVREHDPNVKQIDPNTRQLNSDILKPPS